MPNFMMHPYEGHSYQWLKRYVLHEVQQLRDDYALAEFRRGEIAITSPAYEEPILRLEGNATGFVWLHELLIDQQPEIERLGNEIHRLRERVHELEGQ